MRGDNCGMQAWFSTNGRHWFCGELLVSPLPFISSSACAVSGVDFCIVTLFAIAFGQWTKLFECPMYHGHQESVPFIWRVFKCFLSINQIRLQKGVVAASRHRTVGVPAGLAS